MLVSKLGRAPRAEGVKGANGEEERLLKKNQELLVTELHHLAAFGMQEHYLRMIGEIGVQGEERVLDVVLHVLFEQLTNASKHLAAIAFVQVREIVTKRNMKPSALFSMFPETVGVLRLLFLRFRLSFFPYFFFYYLDFQFPCGENDTVFNHCGGVCVAD